jgi:hypothetical protein
MLVLRPLRRRRDRSGGWPWRPCPALSSWSPQSCPRARLRRSRSPAADARTGRSLRRRHRALGEHAALPDEHIVPSVQFSITVKDRIRHLEPMRVFPATAQTAQSPYRRQLRPRHRSRRSRAGRSSLRPPSAAPLLRPCSFASSATSSAIVFTLGTLPFFLYFRPFCGARQQFAICDGLLFRASGPPAAPAAVS